MKRRGFLGFVAGLLGMSVARPAKPVTEFPMLEPSGIKLVDYSQFNQITTVYKGHQWKVYFNGKLCDTGTQNWTRTTSP